MPESDCEYYLLRDADRACFHAANRQLRDVGTSRDVELTGKQDKPGAQGPTVDVSQIPSQPFTVRFELHSHLKSPLRSDYHRLLYQVEACNRIKMDRVRRWMLLAVPYM